MVFVQTLYPFSGTSTDADSAQSAGFLNSLARSLNIAELVLFVVELAILDLLMVSASKLLLHTELSAETG